VRSANIVETAGLGRRYGRAWALRDCTLGIPRGRLVALVGPNGAGKSTLLSLVAGLASPTTGQVRVLDGVAAGSAVARDGIAFVAQQLPLPRHLTVADMVHMTSNLNRGFDTDYARRRLADLGIGSRHKVGKLSGGQHAQLALTLALARHPRMLILDEPTAALDPLARHDFMAAVVTCMADEGLSVLLSSHLLAEIDRVADHLVLVTHGRIALSGDVEELLDCHRLVTGPLEQPPGVSWEVVDDAGPHHLVRLPAPDTSLPPTCHARPVGLEELALAYLRRPARPHLTLTGATR
jgi:ABC-2 type transport system ATP-binding protein